MELTSTLLNGLVNDITVLDKLSVGDFTDDNSDVTESRFYSSDFFHFVKGIVEDTLLCEKHIDLSARLYDYYDLNDFTDILKKFIINQDFENVQNDYITVTTVDGIVGDLVIIQAFVYLNDDANTCLLETARMSY